MFDPWVTGKVRSNLLSVLSHGRPFLLRDLSIVDCSYEVWLPHINLSEHPNV